MLLGNLFKASRRKLSPNIFIELVRFVDVSAQHSVLFCCVVWGCLMNWADSDMNDEFELLKQPIACDANTYSSSSFATEAAKFLANKRWLNSQRLINQRRKKLARK